MPNSIADNLQRLVNARSAIADAITEKGGTVESGDGFEEFAADIATIPTSGGGGTPEFFDVTPAENVTVYGKPVKTGTKVTWTGRASFSSNVSGDKLVFTLPSEIRPYTKYLFKCGNGGYGYDYAGYVLPNGEVHIVFRNSAAIAQGDFSWDVIEPDYQVSVDTTKVTSSSGGIAVIDNMAIMQVSLTLGNFSTGWQSALLTVPSDVPIPIAQCPFCVYRGRNTAQYPDAALGTDGVLDVFLDRSLGTTVDIVCIWDILAPPHYGFKIDKTNDNSDTAVTYTHDAVTMTPASMNFTTGEFDYGSWTNAWFVKDSYPVALNLDGSEAYHLDPDDYTKKSDGTASDIQFILLTEQPSDWSTKWKQYYTKDANDNYELNSQGSAPTFATDTYYKLSYGDFAGNFMMAFPKVYFRRTEDATYNYVEVSDTKLGDDWYAYAHVNANGDEVDRIYLPLFKGVIVDSKLRSIPGVIPQGGTTASAEDTAATALGSRWQIWDHSSVELINDLLILMSKSIDSQGKFGNGRESGYDSSDTVTYGKLQTGTLVKGGKFKGFSSSYKEVKVFGIEGFWANRWDRLQGMLLVDNVWKIKMTPPYNFTGTDFVTLSNAEVPTGNGYISKVQTSEYGSIPASIDGGSSTKYFKDYFYKTATDTRVALRGGACSYGAYCGFRFVHVYNTASYSNWSIGASPVYK